MDMRSLLLAVLWIVTAPLHGDGELPLSGWQPPREVHASESPALARSHGDGERLHERWLPGTLDWERSRALAVEMVCDLGVIALAVVDCAHWAEVSADRAPALPGGLTAPDFEDIRRRSIEERMHSI